MPPTLSVLRSDLPLEFGVAPPDTDPSRPVARRRSASFRSSSQRRRRALPPRGALRLAPRSRRRGRGDPQDVEGELGGHPPLPRSGRGEARAPPPRIPKAISIPTPSSGSLRLPPPSAPSRGRRHDPGSPPVGDHQVVDPRQLGHREEGGRSTSPPRWWWRPLDRPDLGRVGGPGPGLPSQGAH